MDCINPTASYWLSQVTQTVTTLSGLFSIGDRGKVSEVVRFGQRLREGPDPVELPRDKLALEVAESLVVLHDSDEAVNFSLLVENERVLGIQVDLQSWRTGEVGWIPMGLVRIPSGAATLGDPNLMEMFAASAPVSPPWSGDLDAECATFVLPGPGWLAVHILKRDGRASGTNCAIRADWVAP